VERDNIFEESMGPRIDGDVMVCRRDERRLL
jgi:hypothetical protein